MPSDYNNLNDVPSQSVFLSTPVSGCLMNAESLANEEESLRVLLLHIICCLLLLFFSTRLFPAASGVRAKHLFPPTT